MTLRIGVVLAVLFAPAHAESTLPEARWLAPGADMVGALTMTPGECVSDSHDTDYLIEVGRAAFQSPLLLGGQAARGGLSCASCHVDGRANPDFFLDGLSGAPGTADISSSIFSKVRDDGVFNPVPIPSLVGIKSKKAFGDHVKAPNLRAFISDAVRDEFQGAPTPDAVIEGLARYVESFVADACPKKPSLLTPRRAMTDFQRMIAAAGEASTRGDGATADFLLAGAQAALGRIDARYPGDKSAEIHADLVALSRAIGAVRPLAGDTGKLAPALASIEKTAMKLEKRLHKARRRSLYDAHTLAGALQRR